MWQEYEDREDRQPRTSWSRITGWLVGVVLAAIVFELFASPALSAVALMLHLGNADWRAAWQVWRLDPNRRRAKSLSLAYAVLGLFRCYLGTLAACGLFLTIVIKCAGAWRVAPPIKEYVEGLVIAAAIGGPLIVAGALLSLAVAWSLRQTIWLPPSGNSLFADPWTNRGRWIGLIASIGPCIFAGLIVLFMALTPAWHVIGIATAGASAALGTFAALIAPRVVANRAEDCWPERSNQ